MQTHPYEDDIPAFALGALDAEEALQVSAHLAVCPFCRKEAAAYEAVAGMLLYAIPPQNPPAHLRRRILAHIAACTESQVTATADN
jgi:anti-sigma factor ChrR (cupin superfamily)